MSLFTNAQQERAHLRAVPIDRLGVDLKLRDMLLKLGVDTLGRLDVAIEHRHLCSDAFQSILCQRFQSRGERAVVDRARSLWGRSSRNGQDPQDAPKNSERTGLLHAPRQHRRCCGSSRREAVP